jgi:hypothetical protein
MIDLPRRASSSLTFFLLGGGFLLESGYTQLPVTLVQRAHAGLRLSHLSLRARQDVQARGSNAHLSSLTSAMLCHE